MLLIYFIHTTIYTHAIVIVQQNIRVFAGSVQFPKQMQEGTRFEWPGHGETGKPLNDNNCSREREREDKTERWRGINYLSVACSRMGGSIRQRIRWSPEKGMAFPFIVPTAIQLIAPAADKRVQSWKYPVESSGWTACLTALERPQPPISLYPPRQLS